MKKVIYDFGSNNGDDIPYYILRSDLAVAVEANPELCAQIKKRFSAEIDQGQLVVENYVLTDSTEQKSAPFYIHTKDHLLSQFPEPSADTINDFTLTQLSSASPLQLFEKHGDPHYVKIDIEGYDAQILGHLFRNGVMPPYISAEMHDAEIISILIKEGGYDAFKIVDAGTVCTQYADQTFTLSDGSTASHSFPYHSAGPFGEDIHGPWFTGAYMDGYLTFYGGGWKDLHASKNATASNCRFSATREQAKLGLAKLRRRTRRLIKKVQKSSPPQG